MIPATPEGELFPGAAHGGILWALRFGPLVARLRETSVIFGTIFACLFLKEQFDPVCYAAAVLVTMGGVAIKAL